MLNIDELPDPPSRDDPANFSDRADQFLGAMPNFRDQVNAALNILSTAGTVGVSTTSVAVGTGSKSFTAEAGKVWTAGAFVLVVSGANIGRQMHGQVTAYNPTTGALTVNVIVANGTGTAADWIIMLAAPDLMPLYSTDAGKGASLIGVNDGAGNFTGTTVEAVLAELFGAMARKGAENTFTQANTFNEPVTVPNGVSGGHAVNLTQLLARAALAGSASQVFAVAAATNGEHAVRRDQSFAIGQTWQDMIASRALGTTYTNTTAKAIVVAVTTHNTGGNDCDLRVDVGGLRVYEEFIASPYVNSKLTCSVIVPAGSTYRAQSVDVLTQWFELR